MNRKANPKIILDDETYEVERIYVSDLGYLIVRLYSDKNKSYTSYNLGVHNPEKNIFSDAIKKG